MYDLTRTPVECTFLHSTGFLYYILYINSEGLTNEEPRCILQMLIENRTVGGPASVI